MSDTQPTRAITRRTALGQMAAQAAGMAGLAAVGSAGESRSTGAALVERTEAGSEIWQVTHEEFSQSNIYCEVPYCSRDSRYFVYERANPKLSGDQRELMVVELGTWKQERLDVATSISGSAISHEGLFYYIKRASGGESDLMRADLGTGRIDQVYPFGDGLRIRGRKAGFAMCLQFHVTKYCIPLIAAIRKAPLTRMAK